LINSTVEPRRGRITKNKHVIVAKEQALQNRRIVKQITPAIKVLAALLPSVVLTTLFKFTTVRRLSLDLQPHIELFFDSLA